METRLQVSILNIIMDNYSWEISLNSCWKLLNLELVFILVYWLLSDSCLMFKIVYRILLYHWLNNFVTSPKKKKIEFIKNTWKRERILGSIGSFFISEISFYNKLKKEKKKKNCRRRNKWIIKWWNNMNLSMGFQDYKNILFSNSLI